jgi:hypothetical protein
VFVSLYVCEQMLYVLWRNKSDTTARAADDELSAVAPLQLPQLSQILGISSAAAASTIYCNHLMTAGRGMCVQAHCELLIAASQRVLV